MNPTQPAPAMANVPNMQNPYARDMMTTAYQQNQFNQMSQPKLVQQQMMAQALRSQ